MATEWPHLPQASGTLGLAKRHLTSRRSYATTCLPLFIYRNAFEYLRYGYAAAATLTMFVITGVIVFIPVADRKRWRHALMV